MHDATKPYAPSAGLNYAISGILLMALGGFLTTAEGGEAWVLALIGFAIAAGGFYWLVVGAVARGIQVSRQD